MIPDIERHFSFHGGYFKIFNCLGSKMRGLGPPKKLWNSWNIDLIAEYHNLIPRLSLLKVAGEGKPGNEVESSIAILARV